MTPVVLSFIDLICFHWWTTGNPLIGLLSSATIASDIHIHHRSTSPASLKTSSTTRPRPSQHFGAWLINGLRPTRGESHSSLSGTLLQGDGASRNLFSRAISTNPPFA